MTLPVTATALGNRLGISTAAASDRQLLEAAITDAVTDVEAYLGRAVIPREYTEAHRWPTWNGFNLTPLDQPVIEITAQVPETTGDPPYPTGYYTVTYLAGIDCRDPDKAPILRYITAAAMNDPAVVRLWQRVTSVQGPITSVSTDGQAVSYGTVTLGGGGTPGSQAPGALPTLASLDRWRLAGRRVFTRKATARDDIWPYGGGLWSPW